MQSTGKRMISVEKIGGTSMSAFGDVLRHIMLYDKVRILGRIYVVSAYSGVTNQLLEHKKTGEPGIYALFADGEVHFLHDNTPSEDIEAMATVAGGESVNLPERP